MIRQHIILFLIILLLPFVANALPGGAPVPACTATAPSQATGAGFTNLTFCDALSNTQTIDIKNTRAPGFKWYWPLFSTDTAPPASANLNDGTGSYVVASETSMTTASGNPSSGYTGKVFGGGFYAEASMKWVAASGCSLWPVFWFQSVNLIQSTQTYPNHEIDVFEFVGCNATPGTNVYERTSSPTTGYGNSNNLPTIGGSPNFAQYHKYGVLWQTQAQTGGAGTIKFYFDDVLQSTSTVTYQTGGAPSPSNCRGPTLTTGNVTCPTGTFSTIDTDQMALILNGTIPGNSSNRAVYKDVHVWQVSR